jgi:hypothetical protein
MSITVAEYSKVVIRICFGFRISDFVLWRY